MLDEEPLLGFMTLFMGFPICAGLSIVFEHVRLQIEKEEEDPILKKHPSNPNASVTQRTEYRISDLAGTPWAKKAPQKRDPS